MGISDLCYISGTNNKTNIRKLHKLLEIHGLGTRICNQHCYILDEIILQLIRWRCEDLPFTYHLHHGLKMPAQGREQRVVRARVAVVEAY